MTLPSSGAISLSQVNTELGYSSTAQISLNDSAVRTLFGESSGVVDFNSGHGKANQFFFNISGGQNLNLHSLAIAAGWNQSSQLWATVTGNIGSTSTGAYALTVDGSYAQGVWLTINSGVYVVGAGGKGGDGAYASDANPGLPGGPAINCSSAVNITNNGVIGGGGGGGSGGAPPAYRGATGGGAGGGGAGYVSGAGGAPNGSPYPYGPGAPGTLTSGGVGNTNSQGASPGGTGGSLGQAGAVGAYTDGRWQQAPGGAAGSAIVGSGNVSWSYQGTIYGALN
jgi:hypothetical protein